MPSSDYSFIGGGLKLKGAGVDKKKKKHKEKFEKHAERAQSAENTKVGISDDRPPQRDLQKALAEEDEVDEKRKEDALEGSGKQPDVHKPSVYKTEAQRRYEERRKQRLDERLRREGVQTHKERVEQLNKYLSGLSEHHDMPRIGPG